MTVVAWATDQGKRYVELVDGFERPSLQDLGEDEVTRYPQTPHCLFKLVASSTACVKIEFKWVVALVKGRNIQWHLRRVVPPTPTRKYARGLEKKNLVPTRYIYTQLGDGYQSPQVFSSQNAYGYLGYARLSKQVTADCRG
ncbi:hypothetical protein OF83DRAFT_1137854 [Amylostereum chailletii]|nr:hypothetical protein OF83DRAFT_1137854 [Amylostereum chailletii]